MTRQLTYNGRVLTYWCAGNGPAVVLLHGFGETGAIWDFQKEALQQHFQILIPDLPGSGGSEKIPDMRMEGLADAVYFVLRQHGIERCVLVGHSMGGYVALAFAEKYETALNGLGLFQSTAYADSDEKRATRRKGIQFIQEHGACNFLKTALPNTYTAATKEHRAALIAKQMEAARGFTPDVLTAYHVAMLQRPDRTAWLRRTALPVLFVMSRQDPAVPLADSLEQCHLPQLAHIHLLQQSGHMGMVEEPEAATALLETYLSETVG